MNKNLDLCISNLGTVRNNQYQMAILPWGATEPHNLHLPYLTDCILSHSIAVDAAVQLAADKGVNCMVLPPVAMGARIPDSMMWLSVSITDMRLRKQFCRIS